jgi:transcriptional regulator with XRE-family HTH domain
MNTAENIRAKRKLLGKSDIEVAAAIGINIHAYGDVEQHEEEFSTALPLSVARRLCLVLDLNLLQLVGRSTVRESTYEPKMARGTLVHQQRSTLGMNLKRVAEHIGFTEATISSIETMPGFLDTLPVQTVLEISDLLSLPPDIMLLEES